ncbi:MAG: hypothetical protein ACLUN0_12845 [Roseburia sp.]
MKKNLEVSMLGTFRMQYGNHSFIIDRKSTTKTNRLLPDHSACGYRRGNKGRTGGKTLGK